MALAAFVSEKQSVRLGPNLEASVGFLPGLFAVVALGPISAIFVVGIGLLATFGHPWERWLIWTGSRCLVYGVAALVALSTISENTFLQLCIRVSLASVVVFFGEAIFGTITVYIRRSAESAVEHFSDILRISASVVIVYIPIIAGLDYAYTQFSSWAVVLFIGPAIAAHRYHVLYRNQQEATSALAQAVRKLERINISFATALVTALDARDHYTAGHSATVAVYARDIAKRLELTEDEQRRAHLCGLLHDLGKIGVPTGILEKEGPLANAERRAIENHAEVGAAILGRIEGYEEIANAVLHHHERHDGRGYPHGLIGEEIPMLARLVAVADAYSAMTSERPYRDALQYEEARVRIQNEAEKQFDPQVVKAFLCVLLEEGDAYASGTHRDFEQEIRELAALESHELSVFAETTLV